MEITLTKERAMLVSMFVLGLAIGWLWLSLASAKDRARQEVWASCMVDYNGQGLLEEYLMECMN